MSSADKQHLLGVVVEQNWSGWLRNATVVARVGYHNTQHKVVAHLATIEKPRFTSIITENRLCGYGLFKDFGSLS
jgi:hypothetical protein